MATQAVLRVQETTGCRDRALIELLLRSCQNDPEMAVNIFFDHDCDEQKLRRALTAQSGEWQAVQRPVNPGESVRVRPWVVEPRFHWGNISKGDVGTVQKVEGEKCWVNFSKQQNWVAEVKELEVVVKGSAQPPTPAPAPAPAPSADFSAPLTREPSLPVPCQYWYELGSCRAGDNCPYLHGEDDKRFQRQCVPAPQPSPSSGGFPSELCSTTQPPPVGTCVEFKSPKGLTGQGIVFLLEPPFLHVRWFIKPDGEPDRNKYNWCQQPPRLSVGRAGHLLLGSRVTRNHDFWKWTDQDGFDGNLGTVVGWKDNLWVKVKWDPSKGRSDPYSNSYRWGAEKSFDVRVVHDGAMLVGRRVKRNPTFWKWADQDKGGEGQVTFTGGGGWVDVRWSSGDGKTLKYRWGTEDSYDIQIIDPPIFMEYPLSSKSFRSDSVPATAPKPRYEDPIKDMAPVEEKKRQVLECSICLEELKDPHFTPCFHAFHKQCLKDWVAKKRECPECCFALPDDWVEDLMQ